MKIPLLKFRRLEIGSITYYPPQIVKMLLYYNSRITITLSNTGSILSVCYTDGRYDNHRPHLEGPAYMSYHDNGNIKCVSFMEYNNIYRAHHLGPAQVELLDDGTIMKIQYYNPTVFYRSKSGLIIRV